MAVKGDLFSAAFTNQPSVEEKSSEKAEFDRVAVTPAAPIDGPLDYLAPTGGDSGRCGPATSS